MNELVKITETNGKQAVSARELHAFLESKQQFSDWIKNRIKKYDLIENVDFQVFHNFMKNHEGGRPTDEYALSIDCAKELSMLEGNAKGKQARRYFIDCEWMLKELTNSELVKNRDKIRILKEKSCQVREIDYSIAVLMKRRRNMIKEINNIIRYDNTQLNLFPEFDSLRFVPFPNKSEAFNK